MARTPGSGFVTEAMLEDALSGIDTLALGVPVFGSQAEAQAYEAANPGRVALWFDSGTEPEPGDTAVTATGPTWTDDTVNGGGSWTTPTETGVTYSPASGTATPGQAVTVTATAESGYYIDGTSSWQHTFPAAANLGPVAITGGYADSFDNEPAQNPTGWTPRWDQAGINYWHETSGGYLHINRISENVRTAFSLDALGSNVQNCDAVIRARTTSGFPSGTVNHVGVLVGGSGTAGTEGGLLVQLATADATTGQIQFNHYTAGSPAGSTYAASSWTPGEWVNLRVNVSGTTVKARAWNDGTTEPAAWQGEWTLPAVKTGWVGISNVGTWPVHVDWFAAVTTGTAPLS